MNKVIVLGASGMAGHVIYTYLQEHTKYQIIGTTNSTYLNENCISLDVFNQLQVEKFITKNKPDVIINCVGSLIRESKSHPDRTIYCNAYFPYFLKNCAANVGARLVHISTDCVFSGNSGGYYEDSFKDATDVYGLSKSLGEINDDTNLTIRTSIIGPEIKKNGEGLFHWFMAQNGTINGYKSNFWSGVTTLELAKFIVWQINTSSTGLINLTNGIAISKYDLLKLINDEFHRNIDIISEKDYVCDKSLKSHREIDYKVPSYEVMIKEAKKFMIEHKQYYAHYQF